LATDQFAGTTSAVTFVKVNRGVRSMVNEKIQKTMLIGELAKRTGLSRDTIRFYEKIGLITVSNKSRRENNYKDYSDGVLNQLQVVQQLKGFGYTLPEIGELISLYEEDLITCADNIPKIKEKIQVIDEKIQQLFAVRAQLLKCVSCCPGGCEIETTLEKLKDR
jgi:DNA-binding transcriptional MerR regulator